MPDTPIIVTRFAPSPTGYLHIGGARTALFNWYLARHFGGEFRLRIEDTDRARHSDAAVKAIQDGLTWLGLDWDADVVSQFERASRHAEIAQELVERGGAYRCYMTPEDIETERERARASGERFSSPWRDRDRVTDPSQPFVVRLKAPTSGYTVINDAVQGEVRFNNAHSDDLILVRSDGTPTYNLAVVVDDHDMGVTHVLRGDDHLNNAAKQAQIYDLMGWDRPVFAHIPLIHGDDGKKLSKRHGALGVEAYRDMGFLPAGLRNYLLRLGWSHGDTEFFTDEEAIAAFGLDGLNKAPARLDLDKLRHVNAHHLASQSGSVLYEAMRRDIPAELGTFANLPRDAATLAIEATKARASTLVDLVEETRFVHQSEPLDLSGKRGKSLRGQGRDNLAALLDLLIAHEDWSEAALAGLVSQYAADNGLGLGQVGGPLRAALTAGAKAPDIGVVLAVLGKAIAIRRIRHALNTVNYEAGSVAS